MASVRCVKWIGCLNDKINLHIVYVKPILWYKIMYNIHSYDFKQMLFGQHIVVNY